MKIAMTTQKMTVAVNLITLKSSALHSPVYISERCMEALQVDIVSETVTMFTKASFDPAWRA
jgi:hypothetical protein